MSNDIMNRIWWRTDFGALLKQIEGEYPGSARNLKSVLVALADNASDFPDGVAWPSLATIEVRTLLTRRSVQRAIAQAERLGFIKLRKRINATTQYIFVQELLPHVDPPARKKEKGPRDEIMMDEPDLFREAAAGSTGARVAPPEDEGCQGGTRGGASDADEGCQGGTLTLIEPSVEPSDSVGDFKSPLPVPDERKNLVAWVERGWHHAKAAFPKITDVRKVDDGLAEKIRKRGKEFAKAGEDGFDVWAAIFEEIWRSRFLTGQTPPRQGSTTSFKLSLGKLVNRTDIFRNTIDGAYRNDEGAEPFNPVTGELLGPSAKTAARTIERLRSARRRRDEGGDQGFASGSS